jgi:zinc transporter, ZIP family
MCVVQTFISVKELIPTALKYDPHNKVTSASIIAGMVIMSASLLLFTI